MRTARDIMNRSLPTLSAKDSLRLAIEQLRNSESPALPVVSDDGRAIGAFSRQNAIDAYLSNSSLSDFVMDHCSHTPTLIHEDLPFSLISRKLDESKTSNAFVMNSAGQIIGNVDSACAVRTLVDEIRQRKKFVDAFVENSTCATVSLNSNFEVIKTNTVCDSILHSAKVEPQELANMVADELAGSNLLTGNDSDSFKMLSLQVGSIPIYGTFFYLDHHEVEASFYFSFSTMAHLIDNFDEIQRLRQYNKNYRTILNIINETIIVVDIHGKVVYGNKSAEQFFGTPLDSLIGQPISHPEISKDLNAVLKTSVPVVDQPGFDNTNDKQHIMSILPIVKRDALQGAICVITTFENADLDAFSKKHEREQFTIETGNPSQAYQQEHGLDDFVTINDKVIGLLDDARLIANDTSTVLISGEEGVGKGFLAKAIHCSGNRKNRPFVTMHCGSIPSDTFDRECHGFRSIQISGEKTEHKGLFEQADTGTLLLDNIDDMPYNQQEKLLRFLEDRVVRPRGAEGGVPVDIRIMATTTRNLQSMVNDGSFLPNLYYRLNVVFLELPALRNRTEDIYPLILNFLPRINREYQKNIVSISGDFLDACKTYLWPGNVWELKNALDKAVRSAQGTQLQAKDLPSSIFDITDPNGMRTISLSATPTEPDAAPTRRNLSKETVARALKEADWNKSKAAKMLGVSRTWLYRLVEKYNL